MSYLPPGPPKRRKPNVALIFQVLLALVVVGVGGYLLYRQLDTGKQGVISPVTPKSAPEQVRGSPPAERQSEGRTNQIIQCRDEQGREFYTNAIRCEEADLDNRVNVIPAQPKDSKPELACVSDDLRFEEHVQFLPACRDAYLEALTIERRLTAADDPLNHPGLSEYCDLISQGMQSGCPATSRLFCLLRLCQQRLKSE